MKRIATVTLGLAAGLSCALTSAHAQGVRYGQDGYGYADRGYGFGEPLVRGEYVGAPLSRVPRPSDLVPSVWGYGTYGVPTMTGIRSAPVGIPTVYVIDGPPPAGRRSASRDARRAPGDAVPAGGHGNAGGARVIPVTLPRR